ncbi:MAG: endopeptidase La [Acidimicrobiales bacterium]
MSTDTTTTLTLPLLPLPQGVVLPEMVITIALESDEARAIADAAADGDLVLVPRIDDERFARIGTLAHIENRGDLPNGTPALMVRATGRAVLGGGAIGTSGGLWVTAEPVDEPEITDRARELASRYRQVAGTLLDHLGGQRLASALPDTDDPGMLADTIAYWPDLSFEQRLELLETLDVEARLELAIGWAEHALSEVEVTRKIRDDVNAGIESEQREHVLRRQLAAIQSELGEGGDDAVAEYRSRLADLELPTAVTEAIEAEIERLERTSEQSMEGSWIRTWLDTVFDIPWSERVDTEPELDTAREVLDTDHTGLDDVKERLVEYLAVRRLRRSRNVEIDGNRRGGVILALVGPPGVGKTSLGESVARALDRPFVRLALGGIRDEAEIRGHRRTYVGARPGRVVRALTEAGAMNPVVLLDEIDKVGADWRGDPSSALLEVLDPAQNHSFRDHYLEFELDLSDVVFIATANRLDTIPGPLLDRLEVITLDGYTDDEKAAIARDHLLPRLRERSGLKDGEIVVSDEVIDRIAADWTREAGVRQLERLLDKVLRKGITRLPDDGGDGSSVSIDPDELEDLLGRPVPREETEDRTAIPGVATGLAVTGAGGDVLFVEASAMDGEPGLTLTGQLGDVMQESAEIARSYLRAHADELGLSGLDRRLHVHFPAGAVPKDGPSAGITMTTAIASLLSGRRVKANVGMTGEVTLHGRVLPIGGVKQKVLAAHRAGLTEVILPVANGPDLDDVPESVRDALTIHLATDVSEVLDLALEPS